MQITIYMNKYNKIKTTCPKNYVFTAFEVAEIVGCSGSYVKSIRRGEFKVKSRLSIRIYEVDEIAASLKPMLKQELLKIISPL